MRPWNRSFSSSPAPAVRALRRHILSLYKHIHPDRLAQHPRQQAVNHRSFQLLQAAVDRHIPAVRRSGDSPLESASVPHTLDFYVHLSNASNSDSSSRSSGKNVSSKEPNDPSNLSRLSVALPPGRAGLSAALIDLSAALHLPSPPVAPLSDPSSAASSSSSSSSTPRETTLASVVRAARARPPTPPSTTTTPPSQAIVLRHALQRATGVTIALSPSLNPSASSSPHHRDNSAAGSDDEDDDENEDRLTVATAALRRLATVLAAADRRTACSPLHITLHDKNTRAVTFALDNPTGPLIALPVAAPDHVWASALGNPHVADAVAAAAQRAQRLRSNQGAAARSLGVRLILSARPAQPGYAELVRELAKSTDTGGSERGSEAHPHGGTADHGETASGEDRKHQDDRNFETVSGASTKDPHQSEHNENRNSNSDCDNDNDNDNDSSDDVLQELAVMLVQDTADEGHDEANGVLRVATTRGAEGVRARVAAARPFAQQVRVRRTRAADAQRMVEGTRTALGAASLTRAKSVEDVQWEHAVGRLRARAHVLRPQLEGVGVVVGTRLRVVRPDEVEVPWNADFLRESKKGWRR